MEKINMPKINMKDIPDSGEETFVPVPSGTYKAVVSSAEYTQDSSKEFILATFRITEGEHKGSTVRNWFHLANSEARRISLEHLQNLGIPSNFNPKNAHQLIGRECQIITVISETDKGKFANLKRLAQKEIPAGSYNTVVHSIKRRNWSGKNFLEVNYRIKEGEFEGLTLSDNLYTHDTAIAFTARRLKRIGADRDEFDTDNDSHLNGLIGNVVMVSTQPEIAGSGLVYNKITGVVRNEDDATPDVSTDSIITINTASVAGLAPNETTQEFDAGFGSEDKF